MNASENQLNEESPQKVVTGTLDREKSMPAGAERPAAVLSQGGIYAGSGLLSKVEEGTGLLLESVGQSMEGLGQKLEAGRGRAGEHFERSRRDMPARSATRANNSFPATLSIATVLAITVLLAYWGIVLSSAILFLLAFIVILGATGLYSHLLVS